MEKTVGWAESADFSSSSFFWNAWEPRYYFISKKNYSVIAETGYTYWRSWWQNSDEREMKVTQHRVLWHWSHTHGNRVAGEVPGLQGGSTKSPEEIKPWDFFWEWSDGRRWNSCSVLLACWEGWAGLQEGGGQGPRRESGRGGTWTLMDVSLMNSGKRACEDREHGVEKLKKQLNPDWLTGCLMTSIYSPFCLSPAQTCLPVMLL